MGFIKLSPSCPGDVGEWPRARTITLYATVKTTETDEEVAEAIFEVMGEYEPIGLVGITLPSEEASDGLRLR